MNKRFFQTASKLAAIVAIVSSAALADKEFDKLFSKGDYREAIRYADDNLAPGSRTVDVWVKLGTANLKLDLTEKALACYIFAQRLSPKDYDALLGSAKIFNKLKQYERGLDMAQKALAQNPTAEAAWEYANACITLGRGAEAKQALQKVIESDPGNLIANRELGLIYNSEKQYQKALPLLETSLRANEDADIAYQVGLAYLALNDTKSAGVYLKRAIKKNPNLTDAYLASARVSYKNGEYRESADQFEKVLGKTQGEALDYYMLAVSRERIGDDNDAIKAYQSAIDKFGSSTQSEALLAQAKVARSLLAKKNYAGALPYLEFVYKVDKTGKAVTDIQFMLADAYEGASKPAQAIGVLERVIAQDKNNLDAYARLAELYEGAKDAEKARKTYESMLALDPNNPKAYLVLGNYYLKKALYEKALDNFEKSTNLKQSGAAWEGIAIAASGLKQKDLAKDASQRAISMDGKLWESRKILGQISLNDNNFRAASEQYEALAANEPRNADYWRKLALCYQKTNDTEQLAKADRTLIGLEKTNVDARLRYGKYCVNRRDHKAALEVYKELAVLKPNSADVLHQLYETSLALDNKKEAIRYLQSYLTVNPKDADAFKEMGDLQFEAKNGAAAYAAYTKASTLNPGMKGFYKRFAELSAGKPEPQVVKVLTAAVSYGEADVGVYKTLAEIHRRNKEYGKALRLYEKAATMDTRNAGLLVSLGECQAKTGDVSGSVVSYEQAVMIDPKLVKEQKLLGDLYTQQKKTDQAMSMYKKYLEKVPGDLDVAKEIGLNAYEKKNYEDAFKYLGMVKTKEALNVPLQVSFGEACYRTGNFPQAISTLEPLVKKGLTPNARREVLKMIGDSYEQSGKKLEAARIYSAYIEMPGVKDGEIAFKVGVLLEKENPAAAIRAFEKNIADFPRDYRSFYRLGLLFSKKNETLSKASPLLTKVTTLTDSFPEVWLELAHIYEKLGNGKDELAAYKKYLELNPQNVEANKRVGSVLMKKGMVNEGMIYLEMANTLSPNDVEVLLLLAGAYKKTNRPEGAVDLLARAVQIKKDDPNLVLELATLYKETGRYKEAAAQVKKLLGTKKDNKFLSLYAELLLIGGQYADAEKAIQDIRLSDPTNIKIMMLLADVYRAQKKYNEAVEVYKEVSDIDRNFAPALFERAEVFMLMDKPMWAELFYKRALQREPKYALAELGLAKVAKIHKNKAAYSLHLQNARKLDPKNKEILEELRNPM